MNKIAKCFLLCWLIPFVVKADGEKRSLPPNKIYVSPTGNDSGAGTAVKPLRSINKAVAKAQPGDQILVMDGVYRESVLFTHGGRAENNRITLQAINPQKVVIKGSERKVNWVKEKNKLWKCILDNPAEQIMLFSNGIKLPWVPSAGDCEQALSWTNKTDQGKMIIQANFGTADPNRQLTEIAVRQYGISAEENVDYITIKGISVSQVANEYASIYGIQPGAIDTKGGKYWNIENCNVTDCRSVGISIGKTGHAYEDANAGKPEFSDYTDLLSVGHHKINNNHISRCGQAGIFGLLGATSSIIKDNLIEYINYDRAYPGSESAGIRLAMAVDATIEHNLIRYVRGKNSYGVFLGPVFQGARASRNIVTGTESSLFYLFKNHGPSLFDNNVLVGNNQTTNDTTGVKMMAAEANVFVQNLFYNCSFTNNCQPGKSVATSNFLPNTLIIKQTIPALNIDHRWYANLFIGKGIGIDRVAGCEADFNQYANGAFPVKWADFKSVKTDNNISLRLLHHKLGVNLVWDNSPMKATEIPLLTADFFGFFALSKQYISFPDGKKITIDHDFLNNKTGASIRFAGPFYQKNHSKGHIKLF